MWWELLPCGPVTSAAHMLWSKMRRNSHPTVAHLPPTSSLNDRHLVAVPRGRPGVSTYSRHGSYCCPQPEGSRCFGKGLVATIQLHGPGVAVVAKLLVRSARTAVLPPKQQVLATQRTRRTCLQTSPPLQSTMMAMDDGWNSTTRLGRTRRTRRSRK